MTVKIPIAVLMDDGRTLKGFIDQRDYAAVEATDIVKGEQVNIWVRYLAFNVMHRTKQYAGSWEEFNTKDCVEAISHAPEEESDDAERLDPGQPAAIAGS